MSILFDNNSSATLSVQAEIVDTTLTLQTNEGQLFPSPTGGDFFVCTLEDTSGNIEIVRCTSRTGDVLTVTRAQENTTAKVFPTSSKVEIRTTAGAFGEFIQRTGGTMTGELDMGNNILRDPLLTDGEIRNSPIRGTDGGTANQLVVPTAGGDPTIGGSTIVTVANATYVPTTRTLTGGEGIAAIGDLSANRTVDLNINELTALSGTDLAGTDEAVVYDVSATAHKKVQYQSAGLPVISDTGTNPTPTSAQMNAYWTCNNAGAITFDLDTGVGEKGNVLLIEQTGAGAVTVSGTATINSAISGPSTTAQYNVLVCMCTADNVWTVF